jgi:uncharacterized protein YbjT (DUF2867 family)
VPNRKIKLDSAVVTVIDKAVRASGIPYTILRPNFFMQELHSCSLMAALADRFPLARKVNLRLRDLRHQPVVSLPDHQENLYSWSRT